MTAPDRPGDRDQQQATAWRLRHLPGQGYTHLDALLAAALAAARVEGYRTGVADAERGIYVPGSEALAAARAEEAARWQAKIEALAVEYAQESERSSVPSARAARQGVAHRLRAVLDGER